jgi:hypothetical protein
MACDDVTRNALGRSQEYELLECSLMTERNPAGLKEDSFQPSTLLTTKLNWHLRDSTAYNKASLLRHAELY